MNAAWAEVRRGNTILAHVHYNLHDGVLLVDGLYGTAADNSFCLGDPQWILQHGDARLLALVVDEALRAAGLPLQERDVLPVQQAVDRDELFAHLKHLESRYGIQIQCDVV